MHGKGKAENGQQWGDFEAGQEEKEAFGSRKKTEAAVRLQSIPEMPQIGGAGKQPESTV